MDRQEFRTALEYLTHPSLLPTFQEEILTTLVHRAPSPNDYTLALAYYDTVNPTMTNPETLDALFLAMAKTNVAFAFHFSRQQGDATRQIFFESLIAHVINAAANEKTAERAVELVDLPFDQEEEVWFEEFLTVGQGKGYKRAADTLMMRRIATGKYVEALDCDVGDGMPINGLSWDTVCDGITRGLGSRLELM